MLRQRLALEVMRVRQDVENSRSLASRDEQWHRGDDFFTIDRT